MRTDYRVIFRISLSTALLALAGVSVRGQCTFPASNQSRAITFSFSVDTAPAAVLHITVQFRGNSTGSEQIEIPVEWAEEKLHAVSNLRALSPDTTIVDGSDPGTKTLHYPSDSSVTLAYDLTKDWQGRLTHPYQFHPVIYPEYFEINGANALVIPKLKGADRVAANFDFGALPAEWSLATSFGTPRSHAGYCQSFSGPWEDVARAVFTAGDFRINRFRIGRRDAVLAARGQWTFTDDQAIAEIQKVVGIVRDFWHDDNFPYFLVTLKPYDEDHGQSDGSAFTNAFWIYMSRFDSFEKIRNTLAHEAFHEWNPHRMGEYQEYSKWDWFKEGFTTYYASKLIYQAGLLPLPDYLKDLNRDLRRYPATDDPYVRGRGIAVWLDGEIRKESKGKKSLDNAMYDMVRGSRKPITEERILKTIGRYLNTAAQRQLEAAANQGAVVLPTADAPSPGCSLLTVSMEDLPVFDLGFDLRASRTAGQVVAVREDGPAYKAGLRDGQKLTGESFYYNQPDREAKFAIDVDGQSQVIQYFPRGKTVSAPQFHLDSAATAAHPDLCPPK